jgi:lysozyme|tara:strand:+ start:2330 stop:2887 length:558 start_codon:yes stop_codon:yes gene_type:complete
MSSTVTTQEFAKDRAKSKRSPEMISYSNDLYSQIKGHEGYFNKMYIDESGKKPVRTIGIGFNLEEENNQDFLRSIDIDPEEVFEGKELSDKEIRQMYNHSLRIAYKDAKDFLPGLTSYPRDVQKAIIDMSFNLGRNKLFEFKKTREALEKKDYNEASKEMMDSLWATQVKGRAKKLSNMVKEHAK